MPDRPTMPQVENIFTEAIVDKGGIRFAGRKALAQFAALHTRPPARYHKHVVVDQLIQRDSDPNIARCTSYFLRIDEINGRLDITSFGRYFDSLTRCSDGRWRFLERIVELECNVLEPNTQRRVPSLES
jgi:hypothetical protein